VSGETDVSGQLQAACGKRLGAGSADKDQRHINEPPVGKGPQQDCDILVRLRRRQRNRITSSRQAKRACDGRIACHAPDMVDPIMHHTDLVSVANSFRRKLHPGKFRYRQDTAISAPENGLDEAIPKAEPFAVRMGRKINLCVVNHRHGIGACHRADVAQVEKRRLTLSQGKRDLLPGNTGQDAQASPGQPNRFRAFAAVVRVPDFERQVRDCWMPLLFQVRQRIGQFRGYAVNTGRFGAQEFAVYDEAARHACVRPAQARDGGTSQAAQPPRRQSGEP